MTEFMEVCSYCIKKLPSKMIEGEVIIISKMNQTARNLGRGSCDMEMGDPPSSCGNKSVFIVERGFPIQD